MARQLQGLFLGGTIPLNPFSTYDDHSESQRSPSIGVFQSGDPQECRSPSFGRISESKHIQVVDDEKHEWTTQKDALHGPIPEHLRLSNIACHLLREWSDLDQLIVLHKALGKKSDEKTVMFLEQQGFADVNPRTLSTRWQRLKGAIEQAEDERLDDECNDWHTAEDNQLITSEKIIHDTYARELESLKIRVWKDIATHLAKAQGRGKRFSHASCRARYEAIESGNYVVPIDQDPHQHERVAARERRIREAKTRRAAQIAAIVESRTQKLANRETRRRALDEKDTARQKVRKERLLKKARRERQILADRAARETKLRAKKKQQERFKAAIAFNKKIEDVENASYEAMTGNTLCQTVLLSPEISLTIPSLVGSGGVKKANGKGEVGVNGKRDGQKTNAKPRRLPKHEAASRPSNTIHNQATAEAQLNPRSIMTLAELDWICKQRGLPTYGPAETQRQLVARLAAADMDLSSTALSDLLRKYFDKGNGKKQEKAFRLAMFEAEASAAGQRGIAASDAAFQKEYEGETGRSLS